MYIGSAIDIGFFSINEYRISESRKIDIGTPLLLSTCRFVLSERLFKIIFDSTIGRQYTIATRFEVIVKIF